MKIMTSPGQNQLDFTALDNGARQKYPLSFAIITKNEEENLPGCLASVDFASEVIVVDSGSVDATVEIARKFGAKVYSELWQGYGRQKQFAIERCSQPWIFVLDADERVTPELMQEIHQAVTGAHSFFAFSVPRKNIFCGRWLKHAGWWPDRVVRLFKRGSARMSDRLVHEALLVDGAVSCLRFPLLHLTNRNLAQTLDKINTYSSAGADELRKRGATASVGTAFLHMVWAFFHNYLFRLGLLDGGPGLIQSMTDAVNTLFKYLKLWEMRQESSEYCSPESGKDAI